MVAFVPGFSLSVAFFDPTLVFNFLFCRFVVFYARTRTLNAFCVWHGPVISLFRRPLKPVFSFAVRVETKRSGGVVLPPLFFSLFFCCPLFFSFSIFSQVFHLVRKKKYYSV